MPKENLSEIQVLFQTLHYPTKSAMLWIGSSSLAGEQQSELSVARSDAYTAATPWSAPPALPLHSILLLQKALQYSSRSGSLMDTVQDSHLLSCCLSYRPLKVYFPLLSSMISNLAGLSLLRTKSYFHRTLSRLYMPKPCCNIKTEIRQGTYVAIKPTHSRLHIAWQDNVCCTTCLDSIFLGCSVIF